MALRVRFPSIKPQLDETVKEAKKRVQRAATAASEEFADNVISEGRSDIAAAGRFGGTWLSGFTSEISGEGKTKSITFRHSNPHWMVFQRGATIKGKPLLWIPVDPGGPPAREFGGRLFQVKRRRKRDVPLLMSADDKKVKYIGVKKVIIRRKFHLLKIIRAEARKLRQNFRSEVNKG
jgi:hypothetical protein